MNAPTPVSLVPADAQAAVACAVQTAFPGQHLQEVEPLAGGFSSALVLKATIGARPYLLRIERARDAFRDPVRSYACMRTAAKAGLSPQVYYADPDAGIAILKLVAQRPLGDYPGGIAAAAGEAAAMVRRLQATPPFPPLMEYFAGIDEVLRQLRATGLFADGVLDAPLAAFDAVKAAYPRLAPDRMVSSHNDLNPANILYDGQRLWLIDWETGFANDPHVDPAILANWFALDEAGEVPLLAEVFGEAGEERRARLHLMRQAASVFYAALSLLLAAARTPPGSQADLDAPGFAEIRVMLRNRRLDLGSPQGGLVFGKSLLAGVVAAVRDPRFAWAAGVLA